MAIVRSFGSLQALGTGSPTFAYSHSGSPLNLYGTSHSYAYLYRTQPNIRTVVDFLARNIAQLGLHAFRRVSDTDRERLADHQLAGWLRHPNPATTRYRLIESLMHDLGIYANAFWLKVRSEPLGLVRLPPEQMSLEGGLLPTAFTWTLPNGERKDFAPSEIVHFPGGTGYDTCHPLLGISPLETLRRVLAEEAAAGDYRESLWQRGARSEIAILRPKDAGTWHDLQRKQFREGLQEFAGRGAKAGMIPVLEDGMTIAQMSFSAKDSEYLAARKLSREECAAAYHVPLPMVGILEHATFSNIKEQHKHLYQDCLGPWLVLIEEELERQLLIECEDQERVYLEFNIAEKLKGSFEEQATALQMLVGRPVVTANEGRGRLNLPSKKDDPTADQLAPQQGGPASNREPPDDAQTNAVDLAPVIQATRDRQLAKLAKLPMEDRPAAFTADLDRWSKELAADLNAEMLAQLEAEVPA